MRKSLPIDRVSADDLMSLATDRGSTPMQVGAVLFLDTRTGLDSGQGIVLLAQRILSVPRLRRRLVTVPFGCGRPVWVDDAAFAITNHVTTVRCPAPRGELAVFDLAAAMLATPLPRARPLWAATLVTETAEHEAALIIVFHHVLADGIGGLTMLADLVDRAPPARPDRASIGVVGGAEAAPDPAFPRPMPSVLRLVVDAWTGQLHAIRGMPAVLWRLGSAAMELRAATRERLASTSLNRPTGARRRFVSIRIDLDRIRSTGHVHHATVNDVVLTAIGAALHRLLELRGEPADRFVISVPFSARRRPSAGELGNQSGAIPLGVPGVGDPLRRLAAVAETTRAAKLAPPGASTALLGPFFRLLVRTGLFQRFIDRQRMIHTFVTNLRGPEERLEIFGFPITGIVPLSVNTGNITVSFAVLSYAGTLTIMIVADPDACPDLPALQQALTEELAALTE